MHMMYHAVIIYLLIEVCSTHDILEKQHFFYPKIQANFFQMQGFFKVFAHIFAEFSVVENYVFNSTSLEIV